MWKEIFEQAQEILQVLLSKTIIVVSAIIGGFLSAIGYPKEVVLVILTLVIIDLATKHFSIVVIHYGEFTMRNYWRAWKDRHLKSRIMKNHICVKTILYSPLLYIAHKCTIMPEVLIGGAISSILYTGLLLTECQSIMENFIEAGYTDMIPFYGIFKKKKNEILGENTEDKKEN